VVAISIVITIVRYRDIATEVSPFSARDDQIVACVCRLLIPRRGVERRRSDLSRSLMFPPNGMPMEAP